MKVQLSPRRPQPVSGLSSPRERVEQRVEIGRDRRGPDARNRRRYWRPPRARPAAPRGSGPARAWRRRRRPTARRTRSRAHRNRSSASVAHQRLRRRGGARPSEAAHQHRRLRPRPPGPSAARRRRRSRRQSPISLTRSARPKRSGRPRKSISAGKPAAPSAMPTVPRRQARPKLSADDHGRRARRNARRAARRNAAAEPSGSRGSSSTGSVARSPDRHSSGRCRHSP